MNTGSAAGPTGSAHGAGATPRIVRIARGAGPLVAAGAVAVTVWAAVPHGAWLPWTTGEAPVEPWQAALAWPADALADLQTALGARLWSRDAVGGAIGVAAALTSATALVLTLALRAAGLGVPLSTLVALLACSAPLLAWQAGSPLGASPATLVSTLLLWRLVRQRVRIHVTWFGSLAAVGAAAIGLLALIGLAALVAGWLGAPPAAATLRLVSADLSLSGLVLLLPALGRRHSALVPRERVWLGAAALWLLTTPATPTVRAAILLPWAWWLVGAGIAQVLAWRGRHAARWAVAGVSVWIALHAARVPWGRQHQLAALTRTWAEGLVARVDATYPLVREDSARGRLAAALAAAQGVASPAATVIAVTQAREATRAGHHPLVVSADQLETLRWGGVALDAIPGPMGASLDHIVDAMPRGTIVLAVISREAASAMQPVHWQALGRLGLRLADAGTPRAHAIAGVIGARVEALETAQSDAVRLDVQPGDPLGRTGTRSPVDARLEAGTTSVRVQLRDRPFLAEEGLALLFFSTRGDFLGWRAGATPAHLDGPPTGADPLVRNMGVEALPCVDVRAGATTDVTSTVASGALGVAWAAAGDVQLRLSRPGGSADPGLRIVGDPKDPRLPTLARAESGIHTLTRLPGQRTPIGLLLRGPVGRAEATAAAPVRLCAAWPMLRAVDPAGTRVEMPVLPRFESHFAEGWHDMEPLSGGGYFRWMAGPRAAVLLAFRRPTTLRLVLDAQGVAAPRKDDHVRLTINGRALDARPLHPTRGLYSWDVPADAVRGGLNTVAFETTQTVRPADVAPGADPRTLGLLVYGWSLEPPSATRP